MGVIRRIALAILSLSFFVFVVLFGRLPALKSTPIGFLYRLLFQKAPSWTRRIDQSITGGRLTTQAARVGRYFVEERHPAVLIGFLVLVTSAVGVFLYAGWSRVSPYPHHFLIPLLVVLPYVFTYLAATSTASRIHPTNHAAQLRSYPFDYTLYHPGMICYTCKFEKPARSKHCSTCRTCIERCDHHCAWVNNCVGKDNYRWFLGLLASLGVLLTYGAYLGYRLIAASPVFDRPGRSRIPGWFDRFTLAIANDVLVGGTGLLALFTAPLAWGLLAYHTYLIWAGMTTNENARWGYLKTDIEDELAWRGERSDESDSTWPFRSKQVVVIMKGGWGPDSLNMANVKPDSWEKCPSLRELDNVYDLGFWGNLKDALLLN